MGAVRPCMERQFEYRNHGYRFPLTWITALCNPLCSRSRKLLYAHKTIRNLPPSSRVDEWKLARILFINFLSSSPPAVFDQKSNLMQVRRYPSQNTLLIHCSLSRQKRGICLSASCHLQSTTSGLLPIGKSNSCSLESDFLTPITSCVVYRLPYICDFSNFEFLSCGTEYFLVADSKSHTAGHLWGHQCSKLRMVGTLIWQLLHGGRSLTVHRDD